MFLLLNDVGLLTSYYCSRFTVVTTRSCEQKNGYKPIKSIPFARPTVNTNCVLRSVLRILVWL